jgi:hypothetical protein
MTRPPRWPSTFICFSLVLAGCTGSSPLAPSAAPASTGIPQGLAALASRPFKGECQTTITPLNTPPAAACAAFEPVPSAFIEIGGECQITHLGRATTHAVQQLLFALDPQGQPIFVDGQPLITGLRNCAEFIAADGDRLRHVTTGTVVPGSQPGVVAFSGSLTFTGGTGRFASASGSAAFDGTASIITNTGELRVNGTVDY